MRVGPFIVGLALVTAPFGSVFANCCIDACPEQCTRFYVRGDILYWHPCIDGLAFALKTDEPLFSKNFDAFSEKLHFPSDEWCVGFKLGIGFDSPCDFDLDATWTHFEPSNDSRVKFDDEKGEYVIPFNGYTLDCPLKVPFEFGEAPDNTFTTKPLGNEVKGKWDLEFDMVDVGLGKKLYCGDGMLIVRPHMDLRYLCLRQRIRLNTNGDLVSEVDVELQGDIGDYNYETRLENDYWGVGPRVGFDLGLPLDFHWGLYGSFAASLLYGERCSSDREEVTITFDDEVVQKVTLIGDPAQNQAFKRTSDQRCTTAATDLGIGFYWNTIFGHGECCYHVAFKAGWEHHYFFGQSAAAGSRNNKLFREENRDLSTQGLTVTLAVGF